jgi:hypothetical protein
MTARRTNTKAGPKDLGALLNPTGPKTAKKTTTAPVRKTVVGPARKNNQGGVSREITVKAKDLPKAAKKTATKSDPMDKDFTYLADKDPSDLHVTLAKVIEQRTDIDITAKQVQAVLSIHPYFQRSKLNKARPGYVGLDVEIVHQRSVHMVAAHEDAAAVIAARSAKATKKAPVRKTAASKLNITGKTIVSGAQAASKTTARKVS